MEKRIGIVRSSVSGIYYIIRWNSEEQTVWREQSFGFLEMIGLNAKDEDSALDTAKNFLDHQV
jgi:hypothetical protein